MRMPDKYRVNITNDALTHLKSIFDYVEKNSPWNAGKLIGRILRDIDDLEFMPKRFRVAGRSRNYKTDIHSRVSRPFIVYYRVDDPTEQVFITAVRHGMREQPRDFD